MMHEAPAGPAATEAMHLDTVQLRVAAVDVNETDVSPCCSSVFLCQFRHRYQWSGTSCMKLSVCAVFVKQISKIMLQWLHKGRNQWGDLMSVSFSVQGVHNT